ncbi:unnamed protein product [Didymodactylos carnosus]|uniref:protein-disulfide reductase n=1 Tax=Didymodactylos carnosus TaxID=1234261 RepID=A0A8S2DDX9_9BILA|nr:unnamed protein product [Didymodactylos carnosus]CAF3657468.1 unnamed protein product [Didymodactylos carnosus]
MTTKLGGEYLGEKLLNCQSTIDTCELNNKTIGLYFSAHWCGPCRQFTPKLAEVYKNVKSTNPDIPFDIIFISGDHDQNAFNDYYKDMPWKALPFEEHERADKLNELYEIQGIPALVILKPDGEILTTDGDDEIVTDGLIAINKWLEGKTLLWEADIKDYPKNTYVWSYIKCNQCYVKSIVGNRYGCPKRECNYELCEKCYQNQTVKHEHNLMEYLIPKQQCTFEDLFGKNSELYLKAVNEKKLPFDIIFVSSDRDQQSFDDYYKEMPWKAIPYNNDQVKIQLKSYFVIHGIPSLVVLKPNGQVLTTQGRKDIDKKQLEAIETWCEGKKVEYPKLSKDEFVWPSVTCDGCQMSPLVGERYYCKTCGNYDLCAGCQQKGHEHELMPVPQPNDDDDED